jgi:hypothetical protein
VVAVSTVFLEGIQVTLPGGTHLEGRRLHELNAVPAAVVWPDLPLGGS